MNALTERELIGRLVAGMPRSSYQLNRVHQSDAELLRIPGTDVVLAVTTDGIVEEIAIGLYDDPYLAGWMGVTVNASDLAAVGAKPLGLLVSEAIPPGMKGEDVARLQAGIGDSAKAHRLPVLGGDTNASAGLHVTGTAIGVVRERWVTRCGTSPGDLVFASGPLGLGSAFAFARLMSASPTGVAYQPVARLPEGQVMACWATACIDTSDGAIAAFDELFQLNDVGVRVLRPLEELLHPVALAMAQGAGLPKWTMLAGPHGEFELLFTVPRVQCDVFLADAAMSGWEPILLGDVVPQAGLAWREEDDWLRVDTTRIRNLFAEVGGDPHRYLDALLSRVPVQAPL